MIQSHRTLLARLLTAALLSVVSRTSLALPAFPGAVGFGSHTVGGSGRHLSPPRTSVYRVTNLADSGSGTLRACVEAAGPRTCLFEVGGTVRLTTPLRIRSPYLTIAGETAPDPGITLTDQTLRVQTHDVVIRHIHVAVGDRSTSHERHRQSLPASRMERCR